MRTIPDAATTDPSLLKKHSTYNSYHVPATGFTYPSIRTFYRPHPQGEKLLSRPTPLPLLVFIHGLGGSVAQFHPLMTSLVNVAPCLAIDLPGCGLSKFEPKDWDAYTPAALVNLLAVVIESHRAAAEGQSCVLIGHSMGCSLAAVLASNDPCAGLVSKHVLGLVGICPKAAPPDKRQTAAFKKLLSIPEPIFNLWRRWDRRGGTESASVLRFTGPEADHETKKLQVRFNEQSKTSVWRRMAAGLLPDYSSGTAQRGMAGKETWASLAIPIFLIAGESDQVTPATEVEKIAGYLGKAGGEESSTEAIPDSAAPVDTGIAELLSSDGSTGSALKERAREQDSDADDTSLITGDSSEAHLSAARSSSARRKFVLKTTVLPAPASHALLYVPSSSRTIAGLIQSFLADHIDHRLSLGWQLQYLTTEGKWDVKNLAKWQAVQPVSELIANVFRAMKTLREVDDRHSPSIFVKEWKGKIMAVVDISHESPVYDPNGLEKGGIHYHKFPTVSKLPPSADEVKTFIDLIDGIRAKGRATEERAEKPLIGLHCHYGFNRTGFFIVCYLVERLDYRLQDAIDEFARRRPPGIRHEHFIDTLFVRYTVGLKRAPTI